MYNINKLKLLTGIDLPIPELQVIIHQPLIREIALLGEEEFYQATSFLLTDYRQKYKEATGLEEVSNFEVFIKYLDANPELKLSIINLLTLLLPDYIINILGVSMVLAYDMEIQTNEGVKKEKSYSIFTEKEFNILIDIIKIIFCLGGQNEKETQPLTGRAAEIAEKMARAAKKREAQGISEDPKDILSNYISSLGIGSLSLNLLNARDLTLYQLFDQMQRFGLWSQHDYGVKVLIAGGQIELVDWLQNLEK